MKYFLSFFTIFFVAATWAAEDKPVAPTVDELTQAYQREILFLSTYKKELAEKVSALESGLKKKTNSGREELEVLERQWLGLQTKNERLLQKLNAVEEDYETLSESRDLLVTTLKQANMEKTKASEEMDKRPMLEQLTAAFDNGMKDLQSLTQVTQVQGKFFDKEGKEAQGQIIAVGGIAKFASQKGQVAALYPAGEGHFRVWKWLSQGGEALLQNKMPETLEFFMFEDATKEYVMPKEKTILGTIQSGGLIGWLIVVMGLFAALISMLRYLLLKRAGSRDDKFLQETIHKIQEGKVAEAQHNLLQKNSSISRVLNRTISFLKTEPAKVDDAIMEAIIKESQLIDRFGVVILVVASVAPLMGLLGTVTGMISTFDVITLYGTGNPKLLSGGISEALITTMLGLIVAIPALLVGHFLSSKTEGIKSDMEKWALAATNAFYAKGTKS